MKITKKFIKVFFVFLFVLISFNLYILNASAISVKVERINEEYFRARVLDILDEKDEEIMGGYLLRTQELSVEIRSGDLKGKIVTIENDGIPSLDRYKELKAGDNIIIVKKLDSINANEFFFHDYNRFSPLIVVTILFSIFIIYIGRKRGFGAILGLSFTIFILFSYIIPQIINGANPIYITLIGSFFIATGSLFLSHGFNRRTVLTWLSTIVTLIIAIFFSSLLIDYVFLFGTGSEEAVYLTLGEYSNINLKGLLLSAIVIGTLGVLDDVTATQTAVVWELKKANLKLNWRELYFKSLKVGREHIASLVNTLALAYVGASLPLFILLYLNDHVPLWLKINNEPIAEEIARTILGSSALILAVPISSFFAAYFISKMKINKTKDIN